MFCVIGHLHAVSSFVKKLMAFKFYFKQTNTLLQETSFASNQPVTRSLSSVGGSSKQNFASKLPVPVSSSSTTTTSTNGVAEYVSNKPKPASVVRSGSTKPGLVRRGITAELMSCCHLAWDDLALLHCRTNSTWKAYESISNKLDHSQSKYHFIFRCKLIQFSSKYPHKVLCDFGLLEWALMLRKKVLESLVRQTNLLFPCCGCNLRQDIVWILLLKHGNTVESILSLSCVDWRTTLQPDPQMIARFICLVISR